MSYLSCPHCHRMTLLVPHISERQIGQVPQYLREHKRNGRAFVGPRCPGSGMRVPSMADRLPQQREES